MLARVPGSSFKKLSEYYKTASQQQTKPLHSTLLPWSPLGSHSTPALPISQGCWDHASQIKTPGNHNRIKNPEDRSQPAGFFGFFFFFSMGINKSRINTALKSPSLYSGGLWLHWCLHTLSRLRAGILQVTVGCFDSALWQEQPQDYLSCFSSPGVYSDLKEWRWATSISRALSAQVSQE